MTEFSQLGLRPETIQAVADTGYTTPTPIQEQAIPVALAGRDVLGIAQTGTGKTAAFTLPMIDRLAAGRARARMPRSLVLAPTRELADQVAASFDKYAKGTKLSWALLIGGVSFEDQVKKLDRGVDVLIATPGRLLDHFERGKLLLTGVELMVVDEADRMLDMGFIPDIERIFKLTPPKRQTLFFSATMPPEITRLTSQFLKDPTRIEVARPATTADTITQYAAHIPTADPKAKRTALRTLIAGAEVKNGIVFCNRKSEVDIVAKSLAKHGFDAAAIHGDLEQSQRMRTLDSFRKGELAILVASDVAARGLDIPAVSHVFNYDVPHHADDYVHRIGRTGRAGRTGEAFMIVSPADAKNYDKVLKLTKKEPQAVVLDLDWSGIEESNRDRDGGRRDRERDRDGRRGGGGRGRDRDRGPRREAEARDPHAGEIAEGEVDYGLLADELPQARPAREPSREQPRDQDRDGGRDNGRSRDRDRPRRDRSERPEQADRAASRGGEARGGSRNSERRPPKGEPRDGAVVGFGADTPAFLLRAAPLPKETVELED
jgi:superfamily II DNA/RNA helicase